MVWVAIEKQQDKELKKHAGGKAREDVDRILLEKGLKELAIVAPQEERWNASLLRKMLYHITISKLWKNAVSQLSDNDKLVLQFPIVNHSLFFSGVIKYARKRGIKTYAFIHDLEIIRLSNAEEISIGAKWRMKLEEINELELFDGIVVHNAKMKKYINENYGISNDKMVELEIFDYLVDNSFVPNKKIDSYKSCIIAGNLNKNKSAYVYSLPKAPQFELYGINFENEYADNINYHGSFLADELPFYMKGGFGLVWDGDSQATCSGAWGNYLKYNNPHKTSLYLACGIPVIIWKQAALADFISSHNIGLVIDSLEEISNLLDGLSEDEYMKYKANAVEFSIKLRKGMYTKKAIEELLIK